MSDAYVFGYGSLVNRRTLRHAGAFPARISGWRRAWRHTTLRDVAFLTAEPAADAEIEGMIALVAGADWAELDQREWAYARHSVAHQVTHAAGPTSQVEVYAIDTGHSAAADIRHPTFLSYVDAVAQGYLHLYGEEGADRFFATTRGWDLPVLNDRATPRYSRAQELSPQERAFVDDCLARHGASLVTA